MNLAKLLDIITPRLLTEEVALTEVGDHYEIACSMADVRPGERFDAVATMRTFNLFGMALFPELIGEPRAWPTTTQAAAICNPLELLRAVEQMAAYYEAPKGFFDWLDQQVTLHGGTPSNPEQPGFRLEVTPATAKEADQ